MEQIRKKEEGKRKKKSIKRSLILYIPVCIIIAVIGTYAIGISSNDLQYWYARKYSVPQNPHYEIIIDEEGKVYYGLHQDNFPSSERRAGWWIISNAQFVLIPLWVLFSVMLTSRFFYKRELEKPIRILLESSEKIAENNLDFSIEYGKMDELGQVIQSFEKMRKVLYQNNQAMWRMLEERKRLNSAFSHDMRTPITVLKGYRDLLEKYIPSGEVSEEKTLQVLAMMGGQITRLENYTQKMSAIQKLEDIVPKPKKTDFKELVDRCAEIGNMLAENLQIIYRTDSDAESICIDEELVLEVYENLISNAVRYAKCRLEIGIYAVGNMLTISVEDDGEGFSEEALRQADKPFYRDERDEKNHFGLGLYICRVICVKCQGELKVENGRNGGKVSVSFRENICNFE